MSTECNRSRLSADFTKIPYSAALPVPTIIATGVASPSAHGHEITSTDTAQLKANSKLCPAAIQHIAVKIAITITAGTNIPLILSARRAIGAFELPASSTSLIILARVVFSPTFEARNLKLPFLFTVAEITSSPIFFSTGMLSPVMADWSTYPQPSITNPSTGMLSPGFIRTISPDTTCSLGITVSLPFLITTAVFGTRLTSLSRASEVFALERASRYFPTVTSVRIVAQDSK